MPLTFTVYSKEHLKQKAEEEAKLVREILESDTSLRLSDEQLQRLKEKYDLVFKAFQENDDMDVEADNGDNFVFVPRASRVNFHLCFQLKDQSIRIKKSEWIERSAETAEQMAANTSFHRQCMYAEEYFSEPDDILIEIETVLNEYNFSFEDFYDGFVGPDLFDEVLRQKVKDKYLLHCQKKALDPHKTLDWYTMSFDKKQDDYLDFLQSFEEPEPGEPHYVVTHQITAKTNFRRTNGPTDAPALSTTQMVRHFLNAFDAWTLAHEDASLQELLSFAKDRAKEVNLYSVSQFDIFASDYFDGTKSLKYQSERTPIVDVYDFSTIKEDSHG